MADVIGVWVGASFIMMVLSLALIRANKFSKLAEHTFAACALANLCAQNFEAIIAKGVTPLIGGKILFVVPLVLGLAYLLNVTKEYRWVSRYPVAVIIGLGVGLQVRAVVQSKIVKQITSTVGAFPASDPISLFNAAFVLVGLILSINYFLFTRERTGFNKVTWNIGRYLLMIMFGSLFGSVVMTRMSALISQVDKLLHVFGIV